MPKKKQPSKNPALRILPLGGLGEIGKNMLVIETDQDIVVIDAGVLFPSQEMMGIDVVIPNTKYLVEHAQKIRAILITHGHEDHIGALPYVLRDINVPVYAPRMASAVIRNRLREHGKLTEIKIHEVSPGDKVEIGNLIVEWFSVNHSIPDSTGIAIDTPAGKVIHTGDFKIDHDPIIGDPFDYANIARIASRGVFLLLSDSTYAETEGNSDSDRVVAETLFKLIGDAPGRVFVASFASQIARIQIVVDSAYAHARKVALLGRSMVNLVKIAQELGHLDVPENLIISPAQAKSLPDNNIVFMTTGSQGEPQSALVRMSRGQHRAVDIKSGDTMIISASPIPGNETAVHSTHDELIRLGARVIHSKSHLVHVHGHAQKDELRSILNLINPRYFVPIHGEYRMLRSHADIAIEQGMPEENVVVLTDGDLLELDQKGCRISARVPAGHIFIHGLGEWDESVSIMDERRTLGKDGIVTVILPRNITSGRLMGKPKISSVGFIPQQDSAHLFEDAINELCNQLDSLQAQKLEWKQVSKTVKITVSKFLHRRTHRRPLIIPVAADV